LLAAAYDKQRRASHRHFVLAIRRLAGNFFPKGLPRRRELEFASGALNSVEINGSFYSLQRPSSYRRWYAETPAFSFGVVGVDCGLF